MEIEDEFDNRWDTWTRVDLIQYTPLFIVNWDWCKAHCSKRFDAMSGIGRGRQAWIFESPEDALAFKLSRVI